MVTQYLLGWDRRAQSKRDLEKIIISAQLRNLIEKDPDKAREAMADLAPHMFEGASKEGIKWIQPESAEEYEEELNRALAAVRTSGIDRS